MIIVITGPIASGKSTVAPALAQELATGGVRAVVIDLDLVHDRLVAEGSPADDATWTAARRRAAEEATTLAGDGIDVVIAEGSFNLPSDREAFDRSLADGTCVVYVTLRVTFEEALRRAQGDPTRGRSRDPEFLGAHFAARRAVLAAAPATDIVIDTESTTATAAAASIADFVRSTLDGSTRRSDVS